MAEVVEEIQNEAEGSQATEGSLSTEGSRSVSEESQISSIDLLMESYVNLEQKFEAMARVMVRQTGLLQEIRESLRNLEFVDTG